MGTDLDSIVSSNMKCERKTKNVVITQTNNTDSHTQTPNGGGREGGVMSCLDTPCNQTLSGLAKCVYVHDCMDSMKSVYMCHCAVWLSTSTIMSV